MLIITSTREELLKSSLIFVGDLMSRGQERLMKMLLVYRYAEVGKLFLGMHTVLIFMGVFDHRNWYFN